MEEWLPLPGHEKKFQISNLGRAKIVPHYNNKGIWKRGKILGQNKANNGYSYIWVHDGKRYKYNVHRLVALAFIPNYDKKETVNHINGIKTDNRVENLQWATSRENVQHSWQMGLSKVRVGEAVGTCKFSESLIKEIRRAYRAGGITQKQLAIQHSMSVMNVNRIVTYNTWKHVA